MGEHTGLPWQASGVRVRLDGQPMLQVTGPKGVVAYVPYSDLTPKAHLESHGDLNLIVKACNSHDALVKALEFIRDGYANQDVNHVDYRVKVYQVALEALAKVQS